MNAEESKKIEDLLISRGSELHAMWEQLEKMFFMDPTVVGVNPRPQTDPGDVKLTISPSVRNNVVGVTRLLTTNEPHFKARSKSTPDGRLGEVEELCKIMFLESCQAKGAELHVDAVRSAGLFSDVHMKAEGVDDLIETAGEDEKERLVYLRKRTPYLFETMPVLENYPYIGRYGLRGMLRRYEMLGDDIKATWKAGDESLSDGQPYFVRDWIDTKDHRVTIEGQDTTPLMDAPHGYKELLLSVQMADGSELWRDQLRRRQPFLYAMWKGNLWRRENAVLTEMFTAANERGVGILLGFDDVPADLKVKNAGPGVRFIEGKGAKVLSDSAFDPALITLLERVLRPMTEQSTIFPQTLGSAEDVGSAPFSAIAMLSNSGQLPTVPIKRAVTNVIAHLMLVVLRRIKEQGEDLKGIVDMTAQDIPDDLTLEVSLEIKLPQDMFKNVQIAQTAVEQGIASKAWVQENLMQISDSKEMTKAIWKEQAGEVAYKQIMVQYMKQQEAMATTPNPAASGPGGAPVPGADQSMDVPPEGGPLPEGMPPEGMGPAGLGAPGGAQGGPAVAPGGEMQVPQGSTMRRPRGAY